MIVRREPDRRWPRPRLYVLVVILVGMAALVLAGRSPETAVALVSSGALLAAEVADRLFGSARAVAG
ncbi:hypothetical protein [Actinokineospora sp. NBRC 105648]|uniref:hypothetical protein n=1 Tax=Actinokineospora sp. NBRC 105648 TaxID=3032206 RepID=UPI0024A4757E|nr:hypothetical protein [Actinokineospora sp. NBRC 105648]GLZ37695.1 hypothetical protein Acsp05_13200 [Actinokineospora sp. NBRC 105648]